MEEQSEELKLGGNIVLSGFRDVGRDTMVILKKMIGTYVKRFNEIGNNIQEVKMVLKVIHGEGDNDMHEIKAKVLDNGKVYTSEETERNLFVCVDDVLAKIETNMLSNKQ